MLASPACASYLPRRCLHGASFVRARLEAITHRRGLKSPRFHPHVPLCLQVIVYKMKAKKHYRRLNGHRQPLSKILITKIE